MFPLESGHRQIFPQGGSVSHFHRVRMRSPNSPYKKLAKFKSNEILSSWGVGRVGTVQWYAGCGTRVRCAVQGYGTRVRCAVQGYGTRVRRVVRGYAHVCSFHISGIFRI